MRITHLVKVKQIGGAERHLLYLLPMLNKLGVETSLIVLTDPQNPMQQMFNEAESLGINAQRLVMSQNLDVGLLPRLRNALKASKGDILHTHLIHADLLGQAIRGDIRHQVSTRHNDDSFRERPMIKLINRINWMGIKQGIVISEALKTFVQTVESAPPSKINVVPYGMPFTRKTQADIVAERAHLRQTLGIDSEAFVIGLACRLVEQKGVMYAIQALKLLANELPHAHLVIAGDGDTRKQLELLANGLGMKGRVHFLGWREDVPHLLTGFDVFAMPSLWEGFGLVMLEAMAARLPIVGSYVSAIPEVVVHGETGFLVAPRDPEALAYAFRILHDDRSLRLYLGQNGEDRLETRFSPLRMAEDTLKLYERVLSS